MESQNTQSCVSHSKIFGFKLSSVLSKRTKGADLSFEMTSACSVENGLRTDCRGDWQHQQGQEGGYCNNPGDTDKGGQQGVWGEVFEFGIYSENEHADFAGGYLRVINKGEDVYGEEVSFKD